MCTTDEINAIGHGGHDGIEALGDGGRFAGEVDDESRAADPGGLSRQDGGRDFLERDLPHQFTESRHHAVAYCFGGFGCDIARGRTGSTGRHDEAAVVLIDQFAQGRRDD